MISEARVMTDLFGDTNCICSNGVSKKVPRLLSDKRNCRFDLFGDTVDVGRDIVSLNSSFNGTTILVSHDDNETHPKRFDSILDASESDVINDVTGGADNEKSVQTLVEDDFRSGS